MDYDRLYDMLLARRETRTTSTLTLAIIASSASLLLFIFYLQDYETLDPKFQILIPALGIIFPVIGIVSHEITYKYIHGWDNEILNNLVLKNVKDNNQKKIIEEKVIMYTEKRGIRRFFLYLFFIVPILGWTIIPLDWFLGLIVDGVIIAAIITYIRKTKFPKHDIPDFLKDEYKSEENEDSLESKK